MESRALLAIAACGPPPGAHRPREAVMGGRRRRLRLSARTRGGRALPARCLASGGENVSVDAGVVVAGSAVSGASAGGGGEEGEKKGWIHFIGIGGSGLSALAMLALKQGFEVSGSDITWSRFMDKLHKAGARLFIGHSVSNIKGNCMSSFPKAVVISSAIPQENEEIAYAKSARIPIYKRDAWLSKITEKYNLIAVSGTHGKSTTAAMLSYVLDAMGDDLIAVVGANVPQFSGGNIIFGSGPNFVLEADEYDNCFLGLSPSITVVTNLEWDHVDIFQDEEAVQNLFRRFIHQIRVGGHLIICGESTGAYALLNESRQETISSRGYEITTYGLCGKYHWHASSITPNLQGGQDYVLCYKDCPVADISLPLPGIHNVLNSLAVFATVATLVNSRHHMHDTIHSVKNHLRNFKGVSQRFELIGEVCGCHIYDDYAHHPTEVCAVLQAARQKFPLHALWVVFQPHTFSRLAAFMKDFSTAFTVADYVIVTEIYAAREANNWNSCARDLATMITGPTATYIPKLEDVADKLMLELSFDRNQETVVLTLGAGDITTLGPKLLRKLQQRFWILNES